MLGEWIYALSGVGSLALGAAVVAAFWVWRRHRGRSLFGAAGPSTAFLFQGTRLLDATAAARALVPGDQATWSGVMARLGPMFPGLVQALDSLPQTGGVELHSAPGVEPPLILQVEDLSGLTRLTLVEPDVTPRQGKGAVLAALQQELAQCRDVASNAPILIWCEDAAGAVTWANRAFILRAVDLLRDGQELSWPLPGLFPHPATGPAPTRAKLDRRGGPEWFDLLRQPQAEGTLCYAIPADSAVRAETALRDFMQTLTKTFADLPIGLAIFDRARVLQLFNPALADLTLLPPRFLTSRPTLSAVLDALRAKSMLPEPKDYRSWRQQLLRVEQEAAQGLFEETWNLPGGRTYRVIGRPHPNGALAFMFEDITSEISRTNRYRADVELGQSVIDALDEGVAVFSQSGQLVVSNAAYADLWQHDPAVLLSDAGIAGLSAWWRDHSAPSLLWDDAVDFVSAIGDRTPWEGEVRLLDGRLVRCQFRPLTGGATLVAFRSLTTESRTIITRPERARSQLLSAS